MARKAVEKSNASGQPAATKCSRATSSGKLGSCGSVHDAQNQLGIRCSSFHGCCTDNGQRTRRIVANVDVGFGNWLTIRGQGAGLSWDHGIALKNEGPSEWSWEVKASGKIEFKVLLNDALWERGGNHVFGGSSISVVPNF